MATKNEKPQAEDIPAQEEPLDVEITLPREEPAPRKKAVKKTKIVDVKAKEPAQDTAVKKSGAKAQKSAQGKPKEKIVVESQKTTEQKPEEKVETASKEKPASTEFKPEAEKYAGIDRSALVFGGGLLIMGVILTLGRLLAIPFGVFLWPFIFIIPGVLVLLAALGSSSSSGEGLSILGGILTSLGILFLAQSISGWWASWAYAWTLVAPTSVGFAQVLYGQQQNREEIIKSGRRLTKLGFTMFAIGFVFFELVLGVSGYGLNRLGLPVFPMMLIFAGLLVLVNSFRRNRY